MDDYTINFPVHNYDELLCSKFVGLIPYHANINGVHNITCTCISSLPFTCTRRINIFTFMIYSTCMQFQSLYKGRHTIIIQIMHKTDNLEAH